MQFSSHKSRGNHCLHNAQEMNKKNRTHPSANMLSTRHTIKNSLNTRNACVQKADSAQAHIRTHACAGRQKRAHSAAVRQQQRTTYTVVDRRQVKNNRQRPIKVYFRSRSPPLPRAYAISRVYDVYATGASFAAFRKRLSLGGRGLYIIGRALARARAVSRRSQAKDRAASRDHCSLSPSSFLNRSNPARLQLTTHIDIVNRNSRAWV